MMGIASWYVWWGWAMSGAPPCLGWESSVMVSRHSALPESVGWARSWRVLVQQGNCGVSCCCYQLIAEHCQLRMSGCLVCWAAGCSGNLPAGRNRSSVIFMNNKRESWISVSSYSTVIYTLQCYSLPNLWQSQLLRSETPKSLRKTHLPAAVVKKGWQQMQNLVFCFIKAQQPRLGLLC